LILVREDSLERMRNFAGTGTLHMNARLGQHQEWTGALCKYLPQVEGSWLYADLAYEH
jgi:hypothetical protein